MGLFKKEKKLYERDPKDLDLDVLSHLQAALVAKLLLVNSELMFRYRNIVELGAGLNSVEEQKNILSESARHLEKINAILQTELTRITGRDG